MWGNDFMAVEATAESTSNNNFYLHTHDYYEILLFYEGDSKFVIEGKNYNLEPGDIIIVRKNEMHRVYHNSNTKYHRVVLYIKPSFFAKHDCTEYEAYFLNLLPNIGNQIKASNVHSCGLNDSFVRLKKYTKDYSSVDEPIVVATIIEILYLINSMTHFSNSNSHNNQIEMIISYINKHYTEDLDLDTLVKNFYISKQYMCKIFRAATGHTIHDYINQKRVAKAKELCASGKNITEAAILSGFKDYSSFYRAYKKLTGHSPKNDLF